MKEPETGKKENTGKSGYSITTWRLHLWCRHPEWLRRKEAYTDSHQRSHRSLWFPVGWAHSEYLR